MALTIGDRLAHYDVTALIGEGGMGQVYQATDTQLGREVALKVLPDAFTSDPDRLARFEREAKVLASLNHPNIGAIYGLEKSGDTRALVLELIEGPTLADRIKQGSIPLDEALPIAKQIAEALEAAHEQGIIHRDLKPANVKVKDDGTVKVLDFGLAKALDTAPEGDPSQSPTLTAAATQMGVIMGTAAYMSPEQAKGRPVDKRADVWAFGVVLYEMLTGARPFAGDDVSDTLAAVLRAEVNLDALPDETSPRLRQVLTACLQRDAKQRVHDIADVRLAMAGAFETAVSPSAEPTPTTQLQLWQRPIPLVLGGLVLAAVTASVVWGVTRAVPPELARFSISTSPPPSLATGGTSSVEITPDGTRIVYVASGLGTRLGGPLYVRAVDQLDPAPLRGQERVLNPFISSDGNWVGYWSAEDAALKKVSINGGPPITLTDSNGIDGASWGTDDTIVFAMRGTNTGLLRVSAAGGESESLTTLKEGEIAHRWPHILPGGQAVLFTVIKGEGSENMEIAVLTLDTGERSLLVPGGSDPHYAVTGHIIYGVDGTLWAVPFDADRLAVTGDPVPVLTGVHTAASGAAYFSFASDGSLVYLPGEARQESDRTLVWVDRQGRETPLDLQDARPYTTPRLSPDGTRLAVTVTDENIDVWVSDLATGTLRRLTSDAAPDAYPLWTLDGERVVFASQREGPWALFSKAWDGTGDAERLMVVQDSLDLQPSGWSPDGALLFEYRAASATNQDIGILAPDGDGAWTPLLATDDDERAPAISPDGQWIAYFSNRTGDREIYVARFPELGGEQLISRGSGSFPVWSQSGRELFYAVSGNALRVMPVEPGSNFRVATAEVLTDAGRYYGTGGLGRSPRSWDVSPDGQRLLMLKSSGAVTTESNGQLEIILVQNWFQELTERVPVP